MSDHFQQGRFFNPTGDSGQPFSAVPRLLLERRTPWPRRVDVDGHKAPALGSAAATVTFIGHSTFLIQTQAGHVITDPVYSEHAGPFGIVGPRRVRRPAIPFEDLPPIAVVLLSHNHYDHCDLPTLRRLARRFDPLVITPPGNGRLVKSVGIRRVEELDWWQHAMTSPLPIASTPAQHFSARTPFDRNRALWSGFVIAVGQRRIYFAGDTGYASFFDDIPRRIGPLDLALLPIGAYAPRWFMQPIHMDPAEAVRAHLDLGGPDSVAMHFGTFRLTTEGIDDPIRELQVACRAAGVPQSRFRVLGFGESAWLDA